jgi:hypothetical protein
MHSMVSTLRDIRTTLNVIERGTYVRGDRVQLARLINDVLRMTADSGHAWIDNDNDNDSIEKGTHGNGNEYSAYTV